MDKGFKEKDLENLTKLLNFIAEKAEFKVNVKETISFYGLMAWAQQELMKKIKDNILEIKKVHEPVEEPVEQPKRAARKSKS